MEKFLETKRLYLRRLCTADAEAVHAYRSDRRCYEHQRWEDTSMAAVLGLIEASGEDRFLSDKEEQHYAVCTQEDTLAGDLTYFYTEEDRCVTLGITIFPEHQRKGYAVELLQGVITAIQSRHPHLDIVALIDKENAPSIALFERLGFYRECYAESIASYVYVIDGKGNKHVLSDG